MINTTKLFTIMVGLTIFTSALADTDGVTMLLEYDDITDQLYLGDVQTYEDIVPLRKGRVIRANRQFNNHFIDGAEGIISVPLSSEAASYPAHPRRKLEKKHTVGHTEKFSAQVKFAILGSEITAGPTLSFSRNYSVATTIMATSTKGLLILDPETAALHLDHNKKLVVSCAITANAQADTSASAGIKIFGSGADVSGDIADSIAVIQESTPFYVPATNNMGEETSYKNVTDWCEQVFYRLNKSSVDEELSMMASRLIYKNEKNECDNDMDCMNWFSGLREQAASSFSIVSREILDATPRCVTKANERHPYNKCVVRKTEGQRCNPRSLSWQVNHCDDGLDCEITQESGIFSSEIAICR